MARTISSACAASPSSLHDERPLRIPIVPDLTRGLSPNGLDQIWAADITCVRLAGQFAYHAVVLDAFSRKVVG